MHLVGQHIGPDHREAGAHARTRRGAPSSITEQAHPSTRVRGQMDLGNRVEVHLGGPGESVQQFWYAPTHSGEPVGEQSFVALGVGIVEIELRVREIEARSGGLVGVGGLQHRGSIGHRTRHAAMV
jgi:hypothetical protein